MLSPRGIIEPALAAVVSFILVGEWSSKAALAETSRGASVELCRPRGVFVDSAGRILVASPGSNRIVLFNNLPEHDYDSSDWPFSLVPFGVIEGTKTPPLESPSDVAVDSRGRIVVADTGNHAVKIYADSYESRSRPQIIGGRLVGKFSSPEGVAIDERDNIIVFDTGNGVVRILSPDGSERAVLWRPGAIRSPKEKVRPALKAPIAGCYLGKGYVAVAERAWARYSVWRYDPSSPRSETCEFVGHGPPTEEDINFYLRDIAYDGERGIMAYIGSNFPLRNAAYLYLQAVDAARSPRGGEQLAAGDPFEGWRVPLTCWLTDPAGLAFSPEGDLYITDAASHSLQKIGRESFAALSPGGGVTVEVQSTRASIKYSSTGKVPTVFQYGVAPGHPPPWRGLFDAAAEYTDPIEAFPHSVVLGKLLPSTRYAYRYLLSRESFCRVSGKPARNFSRTMFFVTKPAPRTVGYVDFPLTVLLFSNVEEGPVPGGAGSSTDVGWALSEQQAESIRLQLEAARLFFWVNSRMSCNVKPSLTIVADRVQAPLLPPLKEEGGEAPGLKDFLSGLENLVRKHTGRDLSSSRDVFVVCAVRSYDPKLRRYVVKSSPAMTCGLDHLGGTVSIFTYAPDNTWSFIAEYRKHLSIMNLASGKEDSPGSLLNDPGTDRTGVTWDSCADILRAIGKQTWLSNQYGSLRFAVDEDEDGVPDDEPDCPLDEKRFGTSRRTKDTDGDGVSDLKEILASRWAGGFTHVAVGPDGTTEGTRIVENHAKPSPSSADSDGDGTRDLDDKNPLCPLDDYLPRLDITLDGKIGGEWQNASSMNIADPEFSGVLRAAWNQTHLCFSLICRELQEAPSIRLRLDGAGDGFLRGSDNVALVLEPRSDGSFDVRQEGARWPFAEGGARAGAARIQLPAITAAWSPADRGELHVEIGLAKSPAIGVNLFGGEEIGFDIELRPPKSPLWLRVFEPLTLFRGTLSARPQRVEMTD